MSIYREYAHVYDQSGQIAFSLQMIPYLDKLLRRHPPSGNTLLELACGTGTVAVALAEAGWRVYAIDNSADMLAQARIKAEESRATVVFSQQDMRRLVLPGRVDVVTCLYDSMNYMLTSDDLLAVFRSVMRVLRPGGLFLFDMNTAWALCHHWDDETYFTDSPDLSMILRSSYDAQHQRVRVVATCFERDGDCYRKFVEEHVEQAYPNEQIATLLTDAGFRLEASYECFSLEAPRPSTSRIMWVARRRASVIEE